MLDQIYVACFKLNQTTKDVQRLPTANHTVHIQYNASILCCLFSVVRYMWMERTRLVVSFGGNIFRWNLSSFTRRGLRCPNTNRRIKTNPKPSRSLSNNCGRWHLCSSRSHWCLHQLKPILAFLLAHGPRQVLPSEWLVELSSNNFARSAFVLFSTYFSPPTHCKKYE